MSEPLKVYKNIFISLFFSLIIVLLVLFYNNTAYWYDEIIAVNISQLPVAEIIKTIAQEPHPLGLYLLVKLLPTQNPMLSRIITIVSAYSLMAFALFWAKKNISVDKNEIFIGSALFVSSFVWLNNATNIKHDAITFPLLVLAIFVTYEYLNSKKSQHLVLLLILASITALLGYINFIKIMALFVLAVISNPAKQSIKLLIGFCTILGIYFSYLGIPQLVNNLTRFSFQNYESRGPFPAMLSAFGGEFSTHSTLYLGEIFFATILFLFVMFLINNKSRAQRFLLTYLGIFFVLDFYVFGTSRVRYIAELVFLLTLFSGFGYAQLVWLTGKNLDKLRTVTIGIFLAYSLFGYFLLNDAIKSYKQVNDHLNTVVATSTLPTGLIERHPLEMHVRKIQYFPYNELAVPLDPFSTYQKTYTNITAELLQKDGKSVVGTANEISANLYNTQLKRFIYISKDPSKMYAPYYYDPSNGTFEVLNDKCTKKDVYHFGSNLLVTFENCSFE